MPEILVHVVEGRSPEVKKALMKDITDAVVKNFNVPAERVVVQVLEGENAIIKYREVMGATNPEKAAPGTIRKEFAVNMGENSVHGSDAPETAAQEIKFFFTDAEIVG